MRGGVDDNVGVGIEGVVVGSVVFVVGNCSCSSKKAASAPMAADMNESKVHFEEEEE